MDGFTACQRVLPGRWGGYLGQRISACRSAWAKLPPLGYSSQLLIGGADGLRG
jgi:hypothetical protein